MSWIQKQWEREFVSDAETKVKQLVSLFLCFYVIIQVDLKMMEYRMQAVAPATEAPSPLSNLQLGDSGTKLPAYMSLAARYGLMDDDMDVGNSGTNEQTVEQEYQAYITSPLSPKTSDIIKFWEASNRIDLL